MGWHQNRLEKDIYYHKETRTAMDSHLSQKADTTHQGLRPPEGRSCQVIRARPGVSAPPSGNGKGRG